MFFIYFLHFMLKCAASATQDPPRKIDYRLNLTGLQHSDFMKPTVPQNARRKSAFVDTRPDNRAGFHPREDSARRRLGGDTVSGAQEPPYAASPLDRQSSTRRPSAPGTRRPLRETNGASHPRCSFHLLH